MLDLLFSGGATSLLGFCILAAGCGAVINGSTSSPSEITVAWQGDDEETDWVGGDNLGDGDGGFSEEEEEVLEGSLELAATSRHDPSTRFPQFRDPLSRDNLRRHSWWRDSSTHRDLSSREASSSDSLSPNPSSDDRLSRDASCDVERWTETFEVEKTKTLRSIHIRHSLEVGI